MVDKSFMGSFSLLFSYKRLYTGWSSVILTAIVDQTVNRRRRGHRVLENLLPSQEREVAGDNEALALVAFRQNSEETLHSL